MREGDAIRARLMAMQPNERLFRINAGTGWVGRSIRRVNGGLLISEPRPLEAAPVGWPDLCGWRTVTITSDMVGQKLAVFVGEEFKVTGDLRPEQKRFAEVLERMGGIYRVVRPTRDDETRSLMHQVGG